MLIDFGQTIRFFGRVVVKSFRCAGSHIHPMFGLSTLGCGHAINLPEMAKNRAFSRIFSAQRDKYLRVAMSCCEFQSYKKKKQLLVTGHLVTRY